MAMEQTLVLGAGAGFGAGLVQGVLMKRDPA